MKNNQIIITFCVNLFCIKITMNKNLIIGDLRIFVKRMTDEQFQKGTISNMTVKFSWLKNKRWK